MRKCFEDQVEATVKLLNTKIDNLPTETYVRFLPCCYCGRMFVEIKSDGSLPGWDHERECQEMVEQGVRKPRADFVPVYIEVGKTIEWEQEDIDYAKAAERDKWLSRGY